MDAKLSIPFLQNKLQNLLGDDCEATINNPRLKKQVQKSIDNLHAAKQLLKDVDDLAQALSDGSVKDQRNNVKLLRAVYSAEDATDTYVLTKEYQRRQKEELDRSRSSLTKKICSSSCYYGWKSFYSLIIFYKKMKKFNDQIRRLVEIKGAGTSSNIEINNNTRLLSFQSDRDSLSQRQHWERISDFCLEEETQVVGDLQHQINDLVLRLIPQRSQQHCDDLSAKVIAVVGEGGSGKTTLASTVYNRIEVKRHFVRRAWVRIPSVFNARDVLVDILEQVNPAELLVDATLNEAALMFRLAELLFGTRFLIVLDDVNTPHIWESLLFDAFHSQGGKIIITTRSIDNLPLDVAYSTLNMRRLNDEESWKLFSNKVRIENHELNNRKLVEIKEKILKICAGLPSIIVLLAGLLSTKDRTSDEWSRALIRLADKSSDDIMASSYDDLPFEIKPCFLYMGLFPRGFEIPVRRLITLWCAEEFMTPLVSSETHPENLAEVCLEELVTRNMVQVSWRVDGTPKTCCMPNILYDFFSSKAANVGFLDHRFWSSHPSQKQQKFAVRRLAAYMRMDYSSPLNRAGHLRSFLAFDTRIPITPVSAIDMLLNKIVSNKEFGLLRVLDLEGVFKPKLSDNLFKNLFLLCYLGLRSTFVDDIPSIHRLANNLESLDVKHTNIRWLHLSLFTKLEHIRVNRNIYRTILPMYSTMRTLWGVSLYEYNHDPFGYFYEMKNLTKLGVTLCMKVQRLKSIAKHINQLTELQSLKLRSIDRDGQASTIELQALVEHQKLEKLYLLGNLPQSVIHLGFLPPNLRKLTLSLSGLEEDPMPVLGQLPHLYILRLFYSSYKGELMTCSSKGFPRLRQLKLWKLLARVWTVEEGAMPCLRELEIRSCHHLELPRGLQNVTTLKDLVLTNMSMDFVAAVEESLKNRDVYIRNHAWNSIPFPIPK